MAIIDWPTTRAFRGASFSLALDTSESTFTGFFTGNRQRSSHAADRLRATLLLPPTRSAVEGAQREAFLLGLRSTGDWVRLGMQHRPVPNGTLRGSPVVATTATAGARTVTLKDGVGLNQLRNPSFERATLEHWTAVGGTSQVRSAAQYLVNGHSVRLDNATANADHYIAQSVPCRPNTQYSLSAFVRNSGITAGALFNFAMTLSDGIGGPGYANDTSLSAAHPAAVWTLKQISVVTNPSATVLEVRLYSPQGTVHWDAIQLVEGPVLSYFEDAPTLLGGDALGVGGNLLLTAYAGAVRNASTDFLDVPLLSPLAKTLTAGTAVQCVAPTGVWELDDDGLQLDYSAPVVQGGVAVQLRQVIV
jgi:hypothetical protein